MRSECRGTAAQAAGGPFRVQGSRFGDRPRIERQHRSKRRAVAIVYGQPLQVVAHDILGSRQAAGQGILNLVRRLLDDRKCLAEAFAPHRRRQRPVGNLRPLQRRETAQVRLRHQLARHRRHTRNLRAGLRNRRRDARAVDFAQPLHHEGHQRRRLPGLQREPEHVADVRRIESGVRIRKRIPIHVADAGQHTASRAEHM